MQEKLDLFQSILTVDNGYGDIKWVWKNRKGDVKKGKFTSIVAEAPMSANDMPLIDGYRYFMGQEAFMRDSKDIIEIVDYPKLRTFSPLFLWKVMEELKITPDDIDYLVIGLSLAQIDQSDDFKKRMSSFKINNVTYSFKDKISLVPQGVGAKYAIERNFENRSTYLLIDIGFSTIDVVDVIDGKVRPENVKGYPHEGIIKIARLLQEYLLDEFDEIVSLKEVKEVMKTKKFRANGVDHDLSEVIKQFSAKYTERTMKSLKIRYKREFQKYTKIYFVGGGAYFIDESASPIICTVKDPEYYNALGNYYYKEGQLTSKN